MKTALVLGPADHGRPITREEFDAARGQEGYRYELIEGKVYVSPLPNLPHELIRKWIEEALRSYKRAHPDVLNFVTGPARVIVPGEEDATNPEPDLAGYRDFLQRPPFSEVSWDDVSPILVGEIVFNDKPEKDLV